MRAETRAPGHGLSAPLPGLPGGASASATKSSAAGPRPGAGGAAGKEASPTCPEPPRGLRPQGRRQRWGASGRHRAPRRRPSDPRLFPNGTRTTPASCTRAAAELGSSLSRRPLAPTWASASAPPGTRSPEMGQKREGLRGRCPSSSSFPQKGLFRCRGPSRGGWDWAPGVRCCPPTSCRVNPSTEFPH